LGDDTAKHVPAGGFGARDTAPLAAVSIGLPATGAAALAGSGSIERRVGQQQQQAAAGGGIAGGASRPSATSAASAPSAAVVAHRLSAAAPARATVTAASGGRGLLLLRGLPNWVVLRAAGFAKLATCSLFLHVPVNRPADGRHRYNEAVWQ